MFILITAYPAVILLYSAHFRKNSWENLHKKITYFIAILLLIGCLTVVYGSFIEPKLLITNHQNIQLNKFSKPIKIAFISDIQAGNYVDAEYVEKIVERTISLKPDIVILGGDQVDNEGTAEDETVYLKSLEKLAKQIPTYAVQGNHEYGIGGGISIIDYHKRTGDVTKQTQTTLEKIGVKYLINQLEKININGEEFYLFGGDELWSGNLSYNALKQRKEKIPTIAVIHNPTAIFQANNHQIDLMLSGHTHGGQIRLPFIGPVGRVDDVLLTEWYEGLNVASSTLLFVTRGTGESGARARLFCPPEISLLTIK